MRLLIKETKFSLIHLWDWYLIIFRAHMLLVTFSLIREIDNFPGATKASAAPIKKLSDYYGKDSFPGAIRASAPPIGKLSEFTKFLKTVHSISKKVPRH